MDSESSEDIQLPLKWGLVERDQEEDPHRSKLLAHPLRMKRYPGDAQPETLEFD